MRAEAVLPAVDAGEAERDRGRRVRCTTSNQRAVSRTDRETQPTTTVRLPYAAIGDRGIRPNVLFRPTSPQKPAGIRIDPPPSPPVASVTMPPATAAARAARRSAGRVPVLPRVVRRAVQNGPRDVDAAELRRRGLADQHGAAAVADAFDVEARVVGDAVLERDRRVGERPAGRRRRAPSRRPARRRTAGARRRVPRPARRCRGRGGRTRSGRSCRSRRTSPPAPRPANAHHGGTPPRVNMHRPATSRSPWRPTVAVGHGDPIDTVGAMTLTARPGMTVPLPGPLHSHREKLAELADLGYTDIWSAESDGADGFTPLTLAAAWEPRLRLGTAIIPAFTRSPACLAQCVASLADAAPGRFAFGVGSSSNVIVERWNGVPFVEPYKTVRDVVRFLRDALTRREGRDDVRHVRDPGLPPRRASRARTADPRRRSTRGHAPTRRSRGGRGDHQLALGRRRADAWPTSSTMRRAAPNVSWWRASSCARATAPMWCARPPGTRSPPTSTCPCTPRSTSGSAGARCSGRCGTPGRPATARRRWRRSPTRWWTT